MKRNKVFYFALLMACLLPLAIAQAATPDAERFISQQQSVQFEGKLYFPVFESAEPIQQYHIEVLDLATGQREALLDRASQPAVSHAGDAITYKLWIPGQEVNGLYAAQLSDIAGTAWRYSDSLSDQRPQWAPNDSFFYFYTRRESDRQNRLMITQGTQAVPILRPDLDNKQALGHSPAVVSAEGAFAILYQGCEYARCGVWRRLLNGANPVQITEDPSDKNLSASPDGGQVAFMSYERDGAQDWEIYVMAADGSNVRRLTNRPGADGLPTWSSDGQWLAFVRETAPGSNIWDIIAIRPDGTGETRLAELGALHGQVKDTTPDQCQGWIEESISWVGTGRGAAVEEPAPAGPTAPPEAAQEETVPPAAPPQAEAVTEAEPTPAPKPAPARAKTGEGFIVYPVFDASGGRNNYDLMMIDLSTGETSKVLADASQPSLSSDGTWLAYKSWGQDRRAQGLHAAALLDLQGTDWQFTAAQEAQRPSWAPGDLFFSFYSRQESDRANRVMITQGSQAVTIKRPDMDNKDIEGITPLVILESPTKGYVIYQGCETNRCGVWSRTLSGENPRQITEDASDQGFSLSPDGKQIAFMSYTREEARDWEIYVMDLAGTQITRLTNRPGKDGLPTWSPDGQWIAFVRETEPDNNIWDVMAVRPDGSGEKKLFTLGALDGEVKGATEDQNKGWLEEQIAWGAQLPR